MCDAVGENYSTVVFSQRRFEDCAQELVEAVDAFFSTRTRSSTGSVGKGE